MGVNARVGDEMAAVGEKKKNEKTRRDKEGKESGARAFSLGIVYHRESGPGDCCRKELGAVGSSAFEQTDVEGQSN